MQDNRIYMKIIDKRAIGYIKVGKRNLFVSNGYSAVNEIRPLCVLDFYVHESVQRGGFGREIFEYMLLMENVEPRLLGYDRPSVKLISFCSRHYGLRKYTP